MEHPSARLILIPNLLVDHGRIDRPVDDVTTVAQHMRASGWTPEHTTARVSIDGRYIPEAQWEYAVPQRGECLMIRRVPMGGGGGGGGGGKSVGSMIGILAVLALAIAAPYLAPAIAGLAVGGISAGLVSTAVGFGTLGGALLTAGVGVIGMLAVNALIPTPIPRRALPVPQPRPALKEAA